MINLEKKYIVVFERGCNFLHGEHNDGEVYTKILTGKEISDFANKSFLERHSLTVTKRTGTLKKNDSYFFSQEETHVSAVYEFKDGTFDVSTSVSSLIDQKYIDFCKRG